MSIPLGTADVIGNVANTAGNIMTAVGNLFDGGLKAYESVASRLYAIKQIDEDTVNVTSIVKAPSTQEENRLRSDVTNRLLLVFGSVVVGVSLIAFILTRKH